MDFQGDRSFWADSQVLSLASPVFKSMLVSAMTEGQTRCICVSEFKRKDFDAFYQFLSPATAHSARFSDDSAIAIAEVSDYYQVGWLKDKCEHHLLGAQVTVPIVVVANKIGLNKLYDHCILVYANGGDDGSFASHIMERQGARYRFGTEWDAAFEAEL